MVAQRETPPRITGVFLRALVGSGFALAGIRLFLPPAPIDGAAILLAWFGFALGIGFGVARLWALSLVAVPFLGIWYTRATGPEYLGNGDASWLWPITLIAIGTIGIALGVGLHRWSRRAVARHRSLTPPMVEVLLLIPALALLLLGVALDPLGGRDFLRWPHPLEIRRYGDDQVRAGAVGLPFAIYGARASEGLPSGVLRRTIAPPGLPPTEIYTLIYCDERCRRTSEVQIDSAPPGYHLAARSGKQTLSPQRDTPEKPIPAVPFETVEIAGVSWHIVASGPPPDAVSASADLGDASIQIHAPSRAQFLLVATRLRRIIPTILPR